VGRDRCESSTNACGSYVRTDEPVMERVERVGGVLWVAMVSRSIGRLTATGACPPISLIVIASSMLRYGAGGIVNPGSGLTNLRTGPSFSKTTESTPVLVNADVSPLRLQHGSVDHIDRWERLG
jgi:hypothetical protein